MLYQNKLTKALSDPQRIMDYFNIKTHKILEYIFVVNDAIHVLISRKKILFIDGGSNIGQGFNWFKRFYCGDNVDFHLFEPNPNCLPFLKKIASQTKRNIELFPYGIGSKNAEVYFYGLTSSEGGYLSQGGSTEKHHNSNII